MKMDGLPTTKGPRDAEVALSVSAVFKILRKRKVATMSGENGSLNVWIDDYSDYRAQFFRYQVSLDLKTFRTQRQIKEWLGNWMPQLGDRECLAPPFGTGVAA